MENIYYLNLIPSQYRLQPKFMKWLEDGIQKLQDSNSTAQEIISNFDLDTATGVQLDIIIRKKQPFSFKEIVNIFFFVS